MAALANELHYADLSALYTAVGEGHVSAKHVVQRLLAELGGIDQAEEDLAERSTPATMPRRPRSTDDVGVSVPGAPGVLTKLAKCCTPVPGDQIMGFVTRVLADEKVNILSASVTTSGDRVAISRFTFEMGDPKHLGHLLDVVRNVEGVYDVYRVTSAA